MAHCRGAAQSCRFHNGRGKKSACMAVRDRHAGWQYLRYAFCGVKLSSLSFRGAKRRGNLAGPGPITGKPRRKRNCLPESAPQGHFLALRAQGATSAFGLLAMTNLWLSLFYRQPVLIAADAPGPAVPSPTMACAVDESARKFAVALRDVEDAVPYNARPAALAGSPLSACPVPFYPVRYKNRTGSFG